MRASRLLQLLLLLQNRGKLTCAELSRELEVARRTVLRDLDALTEAGLPVVVHRGAKGGVELGFNYRTRLTGLSVDEAEALGVLLGAVVPALDVLGLGEAHRRATAKLLESLPDGVRETALAARRRFRVQATRGAMRDERVLALATAVRMRRRVRLRATTKTPRTVHPLGLALAAEGWSLVDALSPDRPVPQRAWGSVNVSASTF